MQPRKNIKLRRQLSAAYVWAPPALSGAEEVVLGGEGNLVYSGCPWWSASRGPPGQVSRIWKTCQESDYPMFDTPVAPAHVETRATCARAGRMFDTPRAHTCFYACKLLTFREFPPAHP